VSIYIGMAWRGRVMFRCIGAARDGSSIDRRGPAGSCSGQRRRGTMCSDVPAQRRPGDLFRCTERSADR
jgi:hypothetical protein